MSYSKTDLRATHHAMKVLKDGLNKARTAHAARAEENARFVAELNRKYPAYNYSKDYYNSVIFPKVKAETDEHNEKSRKAFIDTMGKTTEEMKEAVQTLRLASDFSTQALDFSDTNLINALHMLDAYGPAMPYSEQRNLCLTFAGDLPALQAIENGMKKNGMKYADIAHKMQARFGGEFLEQLTSVVYALDPEIRGSWTGESYMNWINKELDEKAEIYGLDLEIDPYREQIRKDAALTKTSAELYQEQTKQHEQHKLLKQWEAELQSMEAEGKTEEANRAAKQIVDVFQEDGFKFRE